MGDEHGRRQEWLKWKGNMKFQVTGPVRGKETKGRRQSNEKEREAEVATNNYPREVII